MEKLSDICITMLFGVIVIFLVFLIAYLFEYILILGLIFGGFYVVGWFAHNILKDMMLKRKVK